MRKLKLLIAACALMGAGQTWAQTDVTSTYITNADFSSGSTIDGNVFGYTSDANGGYAHQQAVTDWTIASTDADGKGGAVFAYGSEYQLKGNNVSCPATDPDGNTGNALGMFAVWGGTVQYTQDVTLPAGCYTLTFPVYTVTGTTILGNGGNLFGFVPNEGTAYYCANNTFAIGQWTTMSVSFKLTASTSGKISVGYVSPGGGSAANPMLFLDKVVLTKGNDNTDYTSNVSLTGWTATTKLGTYNVTVSTVDGRSGLMQEDYGTTTVGDAIKQTVEIANGTYDVVVYATSQMAWNSTAMNADAGDAAYVYANDGTHTIKTYLNGRVSNSYTTPGIYTLSNVPVTNGSLTIGLGVNTASQTNWHTIQIKSLTRTYVDLSDLIAEYNTALSTAKTVAATTETISATVLAALNTAITTYDTSNVDTDDKDALDEAIASLNTATANANTSIASYAIIATGSIPDNSIEGWTDTGTGSEFRVNTWSTEGNSDGSGMTTPFIQTWITGTSTLNDGQAYYTLAGLEPGETYYAKALVRAYSEAGNTPNGPTFFVNTTEQDMTEVGTAFTNGSKKGFYGTLGAAATVGSDGKITLGVKISSANYNWVAFKNVSIQSMDDAFDAAVAKVTILEGTIPTAAYDAAYAVVTSYSGESYPTTAAGFEAAIAAIETAADAADDYVDAYAAWTTAKTNAETNYASAVSVTAIKTAQSTAVEAATAVSIVTDATTELTTAISNYDAYAELDTYADALVAVANDNSDANTTLSTAISTAATSVDEATTAAAIATATSTLKTAMVTYVGAANPVGDDAQFDLTFMLTNPDLSGFASETKNVGGWYCDNNDGTYYNSQVNRNAASEDGTKNATYEFWSNTPKSGNTFLVYQKVTLPEGTYNMTSYAFAACAGNTSTANETPSASGISFSANDIDGNYIASTNLIPAGITFVQSTEGEVKIGLKAHDGNNITWMGIGYVELYKVPAAAAVELDESVAYVEAEAAADVELTKTIYEGWNTVILPFSLSASEITEVFGEGTLYSFAGADAGSLNFVTASALAPHVPYLFKANAAKNISAQTISGRTITVSTNSLKTAGTDYNFVGTYTPYAKDADANPIVIGADYVLGADNNFHLTTVKNALKAFRAYIQANEATQEAPARLRIVLDGEATAIEAIDGKVINNAAIYNLAGQQVKIAQKGIYIQNGKKVVVK